MLQFRRITTQKRFIPQIDGLRFVAIASVVFFHIYIYAALERGAVPVPGPLNIDMPKHDVELFFAISGFILGVPFASRYLLGAPKVNLKSYFLRRLTRLEPPYFLALMACVAMQRAGRNTSWAGVLLETSDWDLDWHLLFGTRSLQNCIVSSSRQFLRCRTIFLASDSVPRSDGFLSCQPATLVHSGRPLWVHREIGVRLKLAGL